MTMASPPSQASPTPDENEGGIEFDGTNWIEKPMSVESQSVASMIAFLLNQAARLTDSGRAWAEMPFRCYADEPTKFRKPDVAFVRQERMPADWRSLPMMPIAADLAVEVLSPTELAYEVDQKVEEYIVAGFGTVWVVNPVQRTVRVYGSVDRYLRANDEITGEPFLPGFRCKVAAFFE